jgi:hypothetical protein
MVIGVDGDTNFANFAIGHSRVGVIAHLGRQVERNRKPCLARTEKIAIALVRFLGGPEARVLSHSPKLPTIHGRLHAAGIGVFARETELLGIAGFIKRRGKAAFDLESRTGSKLLFAFGAFISNFFYGARFPALFLVLDAHPATPSNWIRPLGTIFTVEVLMTFLTCLFSE